MWSVVINIILPFSIDVHQCDTDMTSVTQEGLVMSSVSARVVFLWIRVHHDLY